MPSQADERLRHGDESCTIRRTLDIIGEKWTLLVLREAFYGIRRFEDFHRALGCARTILSARLATLVEHGLLQPEPYRRPGQRERSEYRLTAKGRELFTVLIALKQWGDRWAAAPAGPAVEVVHRGCEAPVAAVLVCADGHGPLTAGDTTARFAPAGRAVA